MAKKPKRIISSSGPEQERQSQKKRQSREWEIQFPDPIERALWAKIFPLARDAAYWKHSGLSPEMAADARKKGWSREVALRHQNITPGIQQGSGPRGERLKSDLLKVRKSGIRKEPPSPKLSTYWRDAGFKSVDEATPWINEGWMPTEAGRWLPHIPDANQARLLKEAGYSPNDIKRARAVLDRAREKLRHKVGLQAGKRVGSEDENDRRVSFLTERIASLGIKWSLCHAFAEGFTRRSRSISQRGVSTFWSECELPSLEWVSEVLAHVHTVRDHLHRAPVWPVMFEGELTIDLDVRGSTAVAWVGREGLGVLVAFDTVSFDIFCDLADSEERYAVGLAISWFVDCTVSLVSTSPVHPHFIPVEATGASQRATATIGHRYAPTPAFRHHFRGLRSFGVAPPRAHRVAGHVRTLPRNQVPTPDARSHAPPHIRVSLGPNQTFVRAHVRGRDDHSPAVLSRLSKYSLLADSLGMAERL